MTTDQLIFLAVVGLRFGIPLLIPRFALLAIIACLVLDAADDFMKRDVLGTTPDTSWGAALSQNWWFVILMVVVAGLAVHGLKRLWAELPTPDWPFTFESQGISTGPRPSQPTNGRRSTFRCSSRSWCSRR